jgi:hypothetical protein
MDIPRIFTIAESAHRIHNPFTPAKLATLGAALRLEPGARVLDLASGSGEMLCTWARDHGVTGTGIDMSQLFWCWPTETTGTGTRRPSGSPCADGSTPIPATSSRTMFEPG